jgi:hypothetical protein
MTGRPLLALVVLSVACHGACGSSSTPDGAPAVEAGPIVDAGADASCCFFTVDGGATDMPCGPGVQCNPVTFGGCSYKGHVGTIGKCP